MSESPAAVVRAYYDALRAGETLEDYFLEAETDAESAADDTTTVKFGISEALFGYDAVAEALQEQTATTDSWSLESTDLVVSEYDGVATFADEVAMAWTDTECGDRKRFETRWSGTLVPADSSEDAESYPDWRFVSMHVSTAEAL
ncbi:nuclear transport factor 2 family protein [Natronolimnobius sp. AArcel1]|uniref:nuclear transport factor 2 family protein n=1 Tax=Natronolimnobius sp. AArcel1 TaxID=1679093 RepID=UPI0013ED14F8|nr:nuclear transport factor 2 family protein [Natronolimnobius sp. AArcel1]NGM67678.1 nuclear transport factor 2 family protein [Natronolimnobius sp. AArcel1]